MQKFVDEDEAWLDFGEDFPVPPTPDEVVPRWQPMVYEQQPAAYQQHQHQQMAFEPQLPLIEEPQAPMVSEPSLVDFSQMTILQQQLIGHLPPAGIWPVRPALCPCARVCLWRICSWRTAPTVLWAVAHLAAVAATNAA